MSCHWGYECPAHEVYTGRLLNHGEAALSELWAEREAVLKVADLAALKVEFVLHVFGCDPVGFLQEHKDCEVWLRSEYGDHKPVTS